MSRKRFSADPSPALDLLPDGTLVDMSLGARHLLDVSATDATRGSFFSYVHASNVRQVSRDLTEMVRVGKRRVAWLMRIRTGARTWRWVKATATNLLDQADRSIRIEFVPMLG